MNVTEQNELVKKDCGIHWGMESGPCKKCSLNAKYKASGGLQYGGTPWAAVLGDKAPEGAPTPEKKPMKMKKSQLKEAVKAVVRECLNERCGSYKLIREKKAAPKAAATPPVAPAATPPVAVPPVAPSVAVPPVVPPVVPPIATPPVAEDQPAAKPTKKKGSSDKSGATSGNSDVRSPTSTDVRSPTSTKTSTDAYTAGNVTVTGGAGSGDTSVHITQVPDNTKTAMRGRNISPEQKRAEMGIDNAGDPSSMNAKLGKDSGGDSSMKADLGKESPSSMGAKLGKSDASLGKTNNKPLKEGQVGVGANVVTDEVPKENMGADSKQTSVEDIIKFVIRKAPAIAHDAQKVANVAAELFAKQTGWGKPDPEHLLGLVQKHMGTGGSAPQDECGGMEEAGLTSETGEEGGEGSDEKEEIMLIKVMALITKKLEAMHAGIPGADEVPMAVDGDGGEEPSAPSFGGGEEEPSPFGSDSDLPLEPEEPSEEPSKPPFGDGGDEEPSEEPEEPEEPEDEKPKEPKKGDKKGKKNESPIKEVSAKTQTQGYRVAPNPSTLTQKTDNEKLKPNDPRLTETSLTKAGKNAVSYKTQGASYKVAPNPSCRVKNDDKDRREPGDPELTEDKEYGSAANNSCPKCGTVLANKSGKLRCDNPGCTHSKQGHSFRPNTIPKEPKIKENHRVQARSYVTVNDKPNDPNVMRDPENPYSNGA